MEIKKQTERKNVVVDFKHEDFEFTVKLAKYVDEHTDILESIQFQRKCLDFVNEITTMTARAYAVKFDKEAEQSVPPWEENDEETSEKTSETSEKTSETSDSKNPLPESRSATKATKKG